MYAGVAMATILYPTTCVNSKYEVGRTSQRNVPSCGTF